MNSEGVVRQVYVVAQVLAREPGWNDDDLGLAIVESAKAVPEAANPEALRKAVETLVLRWEESPPRIDIEKLRGFMGAAATFDASFKGLNAAVEGVQVAVAVNISVRNATSARNAVAEPLSDAWKQPIAFQGKPLVDLATRSRVFNMLEDHGFKARLGTALVGVSMRDALEAIAPGPRSFYGNNTDHNHVVLRLPLAEVNTGDFALAVVQLAFVKEHIGDHGVTVEGLDARIAHRGADVIQSAITPWAAVNGDHLELGYGVNSKQVASYALADKLDLLESFLTRKFAAVRNKMARGNPASSINLATV